MKKLLLSILAILLCASFADAQIISIAKKKAGGGTTGTITYVQSNYSNGADNVTLTGVTAGNLIVVVYLQDGAETDLTCSDGTSSLTAITPGNGTYTTVQFFYLLSANSGDRTYTIANESGYVAAYEFSYTGTIGYDTENHNLGDGEGSITTGNITTGGDTAVVIAAACSYAGGDLTSQQIAGNSPTAIIDSPVGNVSIWYRIGAVSNGQATATDPDAGYWGAQIVSFKAD